MKKGLFYTLLVLGAVFVVYGKPLANRAEAFSLPTLINAAQAMTAGSPAGYNSQNLPLLSPAVNSDPNAAKGGGDITVVDGAALAPQSGPSGTVADISTWPTSSQVSVYTVREGDTLSEIASMFGVTTNTIIWANDIKGGVIHKGDVLVILPITGVKHNVAKGETLASLAKKFKADADEIAQFNGLDPSAALVVGTDILIPNGEIGAAPTPSKSTGTKSSGGKKITKAPYEPYLGGSGPSYAGYYSWPVAGGVITQGLHGWNGIDIGAAKGTPIYAAADGVVIVARSNGGYNGGYGNYVVIQHSNGTQTLYGHASKVLVSAGDSVTAGETIALVGATGLATGPHLHFEVRGAKNPFADLSVGDSY